MPIQSTLLGVMAGPSLIELFVGNVPISVVTRLSDDLEELFIADFINREIVVKSARKG